MKYGQVCRLGRGNDVVYYDGYCERRLQIDLVRAFLGDQAKEISKLIGHCIQVVKDRSGRIQKIELLD